MKLQYSGEIKLDCPVNLKYIIESGQTFLWERKDSEMFSDENKYDIEYKTAYYTNNKVTVLNLNQKDKNTIKWKSNRKQSEYVRQRLGLNHNIEHIMNKIVDLDTNDTSKKAFNNYNGLRLVNEPLYPTIISFICSTQMRINRINKMISNISKEFGDKIIVDDTEYYTFPSIDKLSNVSERDLKNQKLGYRAKYVSQTTDILSDNKDMLNLPNDNHKARENLKELMGVGTKVADCILLYGTKRLNIVPVDTWIEKLAEEYYKENIYSDDRSKIARNMEEYFGKYSGYAQLYLFKYIQEKK